MYTAHFVCPFLSQWTVGLFAPFGLGSPFVLTCREAREREEKGLAQGHSTS